MRSAAIAHFMEPQFAAVYLKNMTEIRENGEIEPSKIEKGTVYGSYKDFYEMYREAGPRPIVRIHGKSIKNGELADDFSGFIDAEPHKISEYRANMNVYEGSKLIAIFHINQENIFQYRIELIQNKR